MQSQLLDVVHDLTSKDNVHADVKKESNRKSIKSRITYRILPRENSFNSLNTETPTDKINQILNKPSPSQDSPDPSIVEKALMQSLSRQTGQVQTLATTSSGV